MDDFLIRAALGAGLLGAAAGPVGCFVLWRRMAYVGESVSHIGLLGVAIGIMIGVSPLLGTAVLAVVAAFAMAGARVHTIPADTHVGIIGHIGLAIGYILLASMEDVRADLLGYLFGDVLALSMQDILCISLAGLAVLVMVILLWKPLLKLACAGEIAVAEGQSLRGPQTAFLVLIALLVAFGLKVVGALMIVALIIIPPAAARIFSHSPRQMAWLSAVLGAVAAPLGLAFAYYLDVPAGPSIVVTLGVIYILASLYAVLRSVRG